MMGFNGHSGPDMQGVDSWLVGGLRVAAGSAHAPLRSAFWCYSCLLEAVTMSAQDRTFCALTP